MVCISIYGVHVCVQGYTSCGILQTRADIVTDTDTDTDTDTWMDEYC